MTDPATDRPGAPGGIGGFEKWPLLWVALAYGAALANRTRHWFPA